MPKNRISGNGDRFNQNDIVIHTKSCQNFSRPSQESSITSLELIKVVGLLSPTLQAVTTIKIQLRFFR